jgi:antitoxin (DNA-binding transcriptional repressor) of toxin-antitoxin stability system
MKRLKAILSASGLVVLALSLPSWAQLTRTLPTQTVTLSGTVETIDHTRRVVNIKTPDGKFQTIDVPPSAKRFDELKVGDKVTITYNNTVSARLKPPGEPSVNTATGASTAASEERTMTATISAIDKSAQSITFTGPNGWKHSRRVADPTVLDKIKVGDQVNITGDTNVTVAVQ